MTRHLPMVEYVIYLERISSTFGTIHLASLASLPMTFNAFTAGPTILGTSQVSFIFCTPSPYESAGIWLRLRM